MTARYLSAAAHREQLSQLVERDLSVIKRVSDLRFCSGSQLTRLCFMDSDDPDVNGRAARRALLRLVRLGLLERLPRSVGGVRSGSAGFVYHLGLGGQRLAIARGWQPERRRRRSLIPGTLFVRHTLQVSELHTLLTEHDRKQRFELLELSAEPSCWRSYDGIGGQRVTLKPDSYVRLGLGPYEDSYFIEVDRGTEGTRALERQLHAYVAYHDSGQEQTGRGVFPKVLWLAPDDRRVVVIEDCVHRLPSAARELFRVVLFDEALSVMANTKTV
jgi:Replication-relaxation